MDTWPDVDNEVTCDNCTALININSYRTCRKYCGSLNLECVNAYEEVDDDCAIETIYDCDTDFVDKGTSDALCQCKDGITKKP